jgi:hypothetical protein
VEVSQRLLVIYDVVVGCINLVSEEMFDLVFVDSIQQCYRYTSKGYQEVLVR